MSIFSAVFLPRAAASNISQHGRARIPAKTIGDMMVEGEPPRDTPHNVRSRGMGRLSLAPPSGTMVRRFYAGSSSAQGRAAHAHIHMVERDFPQWEALLFRDYLIANPDTARDYVEVKQRLAAEFPNDRTAYTDGKGEFVRRITDIARAKS